MKIKKIRNENGMRLHLLGFFAKKALACRHRFLSFKNFLIKSHTAYTLLMQDIVKIYVCLALAMFGFVTLPYCFNFTIIFRHNLNRYVCSYLSHSFTLIVAPIFSYVMNLTTFSHFITY